jgi:tryptophanyl-tRNA synthetase
MRLVSSQDQIAYFEEAYNQCSIRYGDMKKQLAEDMVKFISPIRERAEEIRTNQGYLRQVMELGAEKARASAVETMNEVRQVTGLNYY